VRIDVHDRPAPARRARVHRARRGQRTIRPAVRSIRRGRRRVTRSAVARDRVSRCIPRRRCGVREPITGIRVGLAAARIRCHSSDEQRAIAPVAAGEAAGERDEPGQAPHRAPPNLSCAARAVAAKRPAGKRRR
jgi:hypothetical protein